MNGNQCVVCGAPMGEGNLVCKACLKNMSEQGRSVVKLKIINMLICEIDKGVNRVRDLALKLAEVEMGE